MLGKFSLGAMVWLYAETISSRAEGILSRLGWLGLCLMLLATVSYCCVELPVCQNDLLLRNPAYMGVGRRLKDVAK